MIEYYKEIFTKPMIEWSAMDKFAFMGLMMVGLILLFVIVCGIALLFDRIASHKFYTCDRRDCTRFANEGCLRCKKYRKKVRRK